MITIPAILKNSTRRTTFLSEGVKLCGIILAICAVPIPFVDAWVVVWLLSIMTIVSIGTFGFWAYNAAMNRPLLDSEEHTEQMATLNLLGMNRDDLPPIVMAVEQDKLTQNPMPPTRDQESEGE